jgi:hypothetical protein
MICHCKGLGASTAICFENLNLDIKKFLKPFKVSCYMLKEKFILSPNPYEDSLYGKISSYWLAHFQ